MKTAKKGKGKPAKFSSYFFASQKPQKQHEAEPKEVELKSKALKLDFSNAICDRDWVYVLYTEVIQLSVSAF